MQSDSAVGFARLTRNQRKCWRDGRRFRWRGWRLAAARICWALFLNGIGQTDVPKAGAHRRTLHNSSFQRFTCQQRIDLRGPTSTLLIAATPQRRWTRRRIAHTTGFQGRSRGTMRRPARPNWSEQAIMKIACSRNCNRASFHMSAMQQRSGARRLLSSWTELMRATCPLIMILLLRLPRAQ